MKSIVLVPPRYGKTESARREAIARAARGEAPPSPTPAPAASPPQPAPPRPAAPPTTTTTRPYRQQAAERAERIREQLGDKLPWKRARGEKAADGGRGARVPYTARAGQAETFCRCKLSVPVSTSTANTQAQAFTTCGSLVFGKKLLQHLAEVHNLEAGPDQVAKYFDTVKGEDG